MNFLTGFTEVNGYFIIPIISLLGFILNMLCFIIFMSSKFKLKSKLKFLITKVLLEMLFCAFGIGFQNGLCVDNCTVSYSLEFQIFRLYIHKFIGSSLYICTGLIEIFLTYDRYLILINRKNWLNKEVNFKYIILVSVIVSLIIFVPELFATKIVKSNQNSTNSFKIESTAFGESKANFYYKMISISLANLTQIIALFSISVLLSIEFRKFIQNKANLSTQMFHFNQSLVLLFQNSHEKKRKKAEINFIRMTLTLSILNSFMRSVDLFTMLFQVIDGRIGRECALYLKNVCVVVIYLVQSLNFFVLIYFYKRFRKAFRHLCSKEFI